jgi:type II secretory pathway pseudopilin PulG
MRARRAPCRGSRGATFLVLLFAVAITSAALAAGVAVTSHAQQRERETQLLWAGEQIRQAIVAYARHAGSEADRYPAALADLLTDPRSAAPRRFLRRIHDDPMTNSTDWTLIRDPRGRIVGVASRSQLTPIRRNGFGPEQRDFADAKTYADWRFTTVVDLRPIVAPPPAAPASAVLSD